jgi:RimJ/RimL family protein N-acetyltransferase
MSQTSIRTKRLRLRRWGDADLPELTALNKDPLVMEFIGPVLSETESGAMMKRAEESWSELGYGRFAVELTSTGEFIGFIGLAQCKFESHFTPAIEIGWRLAHKYWNMGLATEGANAIMNWAFDVLGLREVVSFTSASNLRSRRVMEKIGMQRDVLDDFHHPNFKPNDPLGLNVLYRKRAIR